MLVRGYTYQGTAQNKAPSHTMNKGVEQEAESELMGHLNYALISPASSVRTFEFHEILLISILDCRCCSIHHGLHGITQVDLGFTTNRNWGGISLNQRRSNLTLTISVYTCIHAARLFLNYTSPI